MCVASGVESLTNVTNTKQHLYVGSAKGVDFMVSHVLMLLLEAEDTLATYTYESDYGNTTITVKETGSGDIQADTEILNPHGYVMSAAAADQSNGNGFAYTAQAPAGKTYDAFVLWWAWGYPQ
jgi:hypothetical protein